jgi:hypothetical protein
MNDNEENNKKVNEQKESTLALFPNQEIKSKKVKTTKKQMSKMKKAVILIAIGVSVSFTTLEYDNYLSSPEGIEYTETQEIVKKIDKVINEKYGSYGEFYNVVTPNNCAYACILIICDLADVSYEEGLEYITYHQMILGDSPDPKDKLNSITRTRIEEKVENGNYPQ